MGYVMNTFTDQFNKSDCVKFVYKVKRGKSESSKEEQLGYFWKECIKLTKKYTNKFYVFKDQKYISNFGLLVRNIFLARWKKIIIIPSYGHKGRFESNTDFFYYTFRPGDNWWLVAKKFYGDGNKAHQLLKYNNMKMNDVTRNSKIKIPFYLVTADIRRYCVR
jgi:hypothetical protein